MPGLGEQFPGSRHIVFVVRHRADPVITADLTFRHHRTNLAARLAEHGLQAGRTVAGEAQRAAHPNIVKRLGFHVHPHRKGA
jgi:hypothetical protein